MWGDVSSNFLLSGRLKIWLHVRISLYVVYRVRPLVFVFQEGSSLYEVHIFVTASTLLGLMFVFAAFVQYFQAVCFGEIQLFKKALACCLPCLFKVSDKWHTSTSELSCLHQRGGIRCCCYFPKCVFFSFPCLNQRLLNKKNTVTMLLFLIQALCDLGTRVHVQ